MFYMKKSREGTLFRIKAETQCSSAIKVPLAIMFMDRFSDIFWHHITVFVYLDYKTRQFISVSREEGHLNYRRESALDFYRIEI